MPDQIITTEGVTEVEKGDGKPPGPHEKLDDSGGDGREGKPAVWQGWKPCNETSFK